MFVVLGKKEYNKMREEIDTLRYDLEYWKRLYEELEGRYNKLAKENDTEKLAAKIRESNLIEKTKKLDLDWFAKWSDEVQKRAAVANLLRKEMDRNLGLTNNEEDEDDEEGEMI